MTGWGIAKQASHFPFQIAINPLISNRTCVIIIKKRLISSCCIAPAGPEWALLHPEGSRVWVFIPMNFGPDSEGLAASGWFG
jgi:hypothetical protein